MGLKNQPGREKGERRDEIRPKVGRRVADLGPMPVAETLGNKGFPLPMISAETGLNGKFGAPKVRGVQLS
jgi:hypothetical protein